MTSVRIAFLLMLTFVACTSARAHGYVVRAIPADRSTLERPPTRLQYWFSEDLERRFSEIKLRDQSGAIIASGGVDEENGALLSLQLPPGLPEWRLHSRVAPSLRQRWSRHSRKPRFLCGGRGRWCQWAGR